MQEVIEINLVQLLKLNININEYLTLLKIKMILEGEDIPFGTTEHTINSLMDKGLIVTDSTGIGISDKGKKVFKEIDTPVTMQNFEDLFDLYPDKTPSGRVLRAKNKEILGKVTKDFDTLYRKYIKTVKTVAYHEEVIKATKNMIADYKRRGSSDFLQKLETYINQNGWERFVNYGTEEALGSIIERL